jgi:hypothetical protein
MMIDKILNLVAPQKQNREPNSSKATQVGNLGLSPTFCCTVRTNDKSVKSEAVLALIKCKNKVVVTKMSTKYYWKPHERNWLISLSLNFLSKDLIALALGQPKRVI